MGLDLWVLTCPRKRAITLDHVADHNPNVYVNEDWPAPDWPLPFDFLNNGSIGAWRCFKGHQELLNAALTKGQDTGNDFLILEDDAVPSFPKWYEMANQALGFLDTHDGILLHGRNYRNSGALQYAGFQICVPSATTKYIRHKRWDGRWCLGSLAYMVNHKAAIEIADAEYDGTPMDLFLVNRIAPFVLEPSLFIHDRSEPSLIDQPKGVRESPMSPVLKNKISNALKYGKAGMCQ